MKTDGPRDRSGSSGRAAPSARRRWLIPLLWIALPALAAVLPWAWHRTHVPRPAPPHPPPLLTLRGDARRDRRAILERAADLLLYPQPVRTGTVFPGPPGGVPGPTSTGDPLVSAGIGSWSPPTPLSQIGLELLPLDPARGDEIIRRSIQMASVSASMGQAYSIDSPDAPVGTLVYLARLLWRYPDLSAAALAAADEEAGRSPDTTARIYAFSTLARDAADLDPARARAAVRRAVSLAAGLPHDTPADPLAAAAAAAARVEGATAARPLVERALRLIPSGAARPLVEARLAARLATVAPDQARALARQAVSDVGKQDERPADSASGSSDTREKLPGRRAHPTTDQRYFGLPLSELNRTTRSKSGSHPPPKPRAHPAPLTVRQHHDVAVMLAATHPEAALASMQRLPTPAERVLALIDMAGACAGPAPARAEALSRRALRTAQALPDARMRQAFVTNAANLLAAYDLKTALAALHHPLRPADELTFATRALDRQPAAAARLITALRARFPVRALDGSYHEALALVATEPDLGRALSLAQQAPDPQVEANALLTVARRLARRGEPAAPEELPRGGKNHSFGTVPR